jgi:cell division protein FtsW (lipid II flippase)
MWDAKRQLVWLVAGLSAGTYIVFLDSHEDDGHFVWRFFVFMELLLLIIISAMFWIYSKKKR